MRTFLLLRPGVVIMQRLRFGQKLLLSILMVAIPLFFSVAVIAALVVTVLLGKMNLPLAVVGHEGSTILVAFNGLRLLVARTREIG